MNYTKGDWKREGLTVYALNIFKSNRFTCRVDGGINDGDNRTSDGELEANACLIALCPTMYEYIAKRASKGDVEAKSIIQRLKEEASHE